MELLIIKLNSFFLYIWTFLLRWQDHPPSHLINDHSFFNEGFLCSVTCSYFVIHRVFGQALFCAIIIDVDFLEISAASVGWLGWVSALKNTKEGYLGLESCARNAMQWVYNKAIHVRSPHTWHRGGENSRSLQQQSRCILWRSWL